MMQILPPRGPQRNRQLMLLGLLVVALVSYAWYQGWYPFDASTAAAPAVTSKGESRATQDATVLPAPLRLEDLTAAPENRTSMRNPFRYGQPPAPPQPPPMEKPVYQAPPQPPPPGPPPGPPPIPLKVLGTEMIMDTKEWFATIQDPDTGLMVWARAGQKVSGKYKVVKVNPDSVVLSYLDGTGQVTKRSGGTEQ